MVRHTLRILQHYSVSDHFGTLCIKDLNYNSETKLCMENETDYIENSKKTLKFDGKRYVTKIPFIENPEFLPDNYILAKKRTENLISKLRKNPG